MENNDEIVVIEQGGMDIIYAQDKASVDIQVSTAHAFPRNLRKAIENAITTVTIDKETAATCHYSLPRGGKQISGPSVHLAKILAQTFGNMRISARVIGSDDKHVTSQAVAWDLENNLSTMVEVKRSIMTKNGRMDDSMVTVTGNAANAIALRNAVFSVIPKAFVDKVYNEAKKAITGDVSDATKLVNRRKQVFEGLMNAYSVTEQEILSAVGKVSVDHITADDLIALIGIGTAIKEGDTTIELAFRNKVASKVTSTIEESVLEDWRIQIGDCSTLDMLTNLRKNSGEKRPQIMAMFMEKEKQLKEVK